MNRIIRSIFKTMTKYAAILTRRGEIGIGLTWALKDEVLTISGKGAMPDWSPSSHAPWYYVHYCITSVVIDNGVTEIGRNAFRNCNFFTNVSIPDSVTTIGDYAFYDCESLTSVNIPDSITRIGEDAFCICKSLMDVYIPNSVTTIGDGAFGWCPMLTSIDVDEANVAYSSVDGVLFNKDKTTLIFCPGGKRGAYTIPDSVTEIGEDAFYGCKSLTSVTIPDSVTEIGYSTFSRCKSLTSVTIPNSVTSISDAAFKGCSGLFSINVDTANNAYSSVDGVLFNKDMTELIFCPEGKEGAYTIPDGVTTIGGYAFYDCESLTSVAIPDSVTKIGLWTFEGCSSELILNVGKNSYAKEYAERKKIKYIIRE